MTDEREIVVRGPLRRIFIQGGGPGSGHHGHKGRPGEVGGSLPSGASGIAEPGGEYEREPLSSTDRDAYAEATFGFYNAFDRIEGNWLKSQIPEEERATRPYTYYSLYRPVTFTVPGDARVSDRTIWSAEPLPFKTIRGKELAAISDESVGDIAKRWYEADKGETGTYVFGDSMALKGFVVHPSTDNEKGKWRATYFSEEGFTGHDYYDTVEEALADNLRGKRNASYRPNPSLLEALVKNEGFAVRSIDNLDFILRGGPGSGHHGHKGRIGKVGGSMPSTGATYSLADDPDIGPSILREWYGGHLIPSETDDNKYVNQLYHYVKTYRLTPAQSKKIRAMGYTYNPRTFSYFKAYDLYEADKEAFDKRRLKKAGLKEPSVPYDVDQKPLTKKAINETIQMTSSRYNTYKKKDVVDTARRMMDGEEWVRLNGTPETTSRELLRDVAGSDDIETRKVNEKTFEVKVNQWVVDSGTYVVEGGAQSTVYLINGPERYVAEGLAGDNPDNFRYEYKRTYFGEQPVERGGEGSGHFDHEGRPGKVGGSKPSKGVGGAPGIKPPKPKPKKTPSAGGEGEGGEGEGGEGLRDIKPLPENREVYPPRTDSGQEITSYGMEPETQRFEWNENLDVVGQIPMDAKREFMQSLPQDTREMTVEQRWDLAKVIMDMPIEELRVFYQSLEAQPNIRDSKRGTSDYNQALRLTGFRDVMQGVLKYKDKMAWAAENLASEEHRKNVIGQNYLRQAPQELEQRVLGVHWWPDEAKTAYWKTMLSDEPEAEEKSLTERGGEGSGHFGHEGREGKIGGSQPSGASGGTDDGADADEGEVAGGMSEEKLKTQYIVELGDVRVPFDSKEQFEQIQEIAGGHTAHAQEVEPEITELVTGLAGQYGGDMSGLDKKIKSQSSMTRKIRLDMIEKGMSAEDAANAINDQVRYTMLFSPDTYVESILQIQADLKEQGWTQYDNKWKNFWRPGDDYDGYHNVYVHEETGNKFELQFHTYDSVAIKDRSHEIYEEIQTMPEGDLRDTLYNEMKALWTQEFEKPEGWEKLPGVLR